MGEVTIVFLSGHGTCSPVLDYFKPVWSRPTNAPRDIDTILEEAGSALNLAGIQGSFVPAVHSLAGLEALYWAKKYPEQVSAVVGLGPAVAAVYNDARQYESQIKKLKVMRLAPKFGVSRFTDREVLKRSMPLLTSEAPE
jgi:pimeloyl-ACP methyl ester carboxylesterase